MHHYVTNIYTLHVEGRLWSGAKCKHSYNLESEPSPEAMTREQLSAIPGDFESVSRYRLERRTIVTCEDSKRIAYGVNLK